MSESENTPFAEFIDDYFVECDEHLSVARSSLLNLEASLARSSLDRSALTDLFRSFHSIKGLSAMVGVRGAEQLAHQMESYLSALNKDQVVLTLNGLELLVTGVQTLEQVIASRRVGKTPMPELGPLLVELQGLLPGDPSAESPASSPQREPSDPSPEKKLPAGSRVLRFLFVPSPELAERAVNVNTVRQRLQEVGELIQAAPMVLSGGQIAFTFLVSTSLDEKAFAAWENDGLTFTPHDTQESPERRKEGSPPPGFGASVMPANVIRVDLTRLDDLMRMVGEMVISRARLDDNLKRLAATLPVAELRTLQETNQALERQLRDLREGIMRVRLVPVREVFARMQFVVRDLAREVGKKIALSLSGQETEIDKFVVERMMDPLLHLVRNAVSHGLETTEERLAHGKTAEGKIALRATTTGETILIEVEDDGRGIDTARVFERARHAGLIAEDAVHDDAGLLEVICAPGFSTRDEADRASGRGVGMAVVRRAVEELGGTLEVTTRHGVGTCFTIQLPLTLAIADALIVAVAGQTFAVPQVAVREVIQVEAKMVKSLENNELIRHRDLALPLVRLGAFFGLKETPDPSFYVLIVGAGLGAVGIVVDRVLGLREIVVRPLTDPLIRVQGIGGATELGDGRVVLILDALPLTRAARKQTRGDKVKSALYASRP